MVRPRILLADEDAAMLANVTRALGPEYDVVAVRDGAAALILARQEPWNLILADTALPQLNGFTLLGELRTDERTQTVPVMLMSARIGEEGSAAAMAAGAVDYLTKPLSDNELRARIAARLEAARVMRAAAAAALDSERRMRLAMDAAKMFSWELDLVTGRTFVTGNVEQVVGFARDSAPRDLQETVGDLVHPDDRPLLMAAIDEAKHTGIYHGVMRLIDPVSGECVWVEAHGTLIRDAAGQPMTLIGVTQNITETRKAAQALRESTSRFDLVRDGAEVGFWFCDLPFDKLIWDNRVKEHFWLPPEAEVTIDTFYQRLHPADRERTRQAIDASIANRTQYDIEYRTVSASGGEKWIRAIGRTFYDAQAKPIRFDGVTLEITDRKQAEQALMENDRRKDEFLAMLAHELRNPLAPIRHAAQVLKITPPGDPSQLWARDVIERQTQHITRLVDDLLDVSRITQGKISLRPERLAVAAVIERAVEAIRPVAEARGQVLRVALPPAPLEVEGDSARLVQVLLNLLSNASKFSNDGGHITVTAAPEASHAVIRVTDDGIGIPRELLPRVFELFTQADRSLDRSQGGLGIGLTLVRLLVDRHGGTVEARSDGPGKGSEFVVRLPLATIDEDVTPTPATGAPSTVGTGRVPLRVLVVEDNQDSAEMLSVMLELQGYETAIAYDGVAALQEAQRFQPQAILCDIGLPGMTGYQLAQKIRALPWSAQPRLVALTGYGQAEDRRLTTEAGFDHHLVKPVEPLALFALLDSLSD